MSKVLLIAVVLGSFSARAQDFTFPASAHVFGRLNKSHDQVHEMVAAELDKYGRVVLSFCAEDRNWGSDRQSFSYTQQKGREILYRQECVLLKDQAQRLVFTESDFREILIQGLHKIDKNLLSSEQKSLLERYLEDDVNARNEMNKIFDQLMVDLQREPHAPTFTPVSEGNDILFSLLHDLSMIEVCNYKRLPKKPGYLCRSNGTYSNAIWRLEDDFFLTWWPAGDRLVEKKVYYDMKSGLKVTEPLGGLYTQYEAQKICTSNDGYRLPNRNDVVIFERDNVSWTPHVMSSRVLNNSRSLLEDDYSYHYFWSSIITPNSGICGSAGCGNYYDGLGGGGLLEGYSGGMRKRSSPLNVVCVSGNVDAYSDSPSAGK